MNQNTRTNTPIYPKTLSRQKQPNHQVIKSSNQSPTAVWEKRISGRTDFGSLEKSLASNPKSQWSQFQRATICYKNHDIMISSWMRHLYRYLAKNLEISHPEIRNSRWLKFRYEPFQLEEHITVGSVNKQYYQEMSRIFSIIPYNSYAVLMGKKRCSSNIFQSE